VEEIVAVVIQVVVEVGLQIFGAAGIDWATGASSRKGDREEAGCGWLVLFVLFGAACGGLSLVFVPKLILPTLGLRIANLIVAPLAAGGLSYLFARHVWAAGRWPPRHHFWRGFWFALAFGIIRFAYVHR
jgi:hypothetical protein